MIMEMYVLLMRLFLNLFSEKRVDILVNAAGIAPISGYNNFFNTTEETYDSIMDINIKGTFFVSQVIARYMIDKHIQGHILNISSSSALRPAWTPYELSKWAVNGFTKGLADSICRYGITVNAIAPGPTATSMTGLGNNDSIYHFSSPMGRYSTPEEIANLALFLVSSTGNMIVGETVYMTGGSGTISTHN